MNNAYQITIQFEVDPTEVKPFNIKLTINYFDEKFKQRMVNLNKKDFVLKTKRGSFFGLFTIALTVDGNEQKININFITENKYSFQNELDANEFQIAIRNELDKYLKKELKTYYHLKSHPSSVR